jgi:6-phosphofructokinase 1
VVGVPGTIDNDLPVTEMALGVQSAVATVVWAVDHFKDTARSHRRVMVLETMGRHSGELTQLAAIASGAEFALIPEEGKITDDMIRTIATHISSDFKRGRTHTIVLVAEGVEFEPPAAMSPAYQLAKALEKFFGAPVDDRSDVDVEVRPSVLGHLQRGGRPDPGDAILAARFAEAALASLISNSCKGGIVAQRDGKIRIVSFDALDDQRDSNLCKNTASLQKALSGW